MIKLKSEIKTTLWGVENILEAQTIHIDGDEHYLLWHSFPKSFRGSGIIENPPNHLMIRSQCVPEVSSTTIFMPGSEPSHDYTLAKITEWREEIIGSLSLLNSIEVEENQEIETLNDTEGYQVSNDKIDVMLFRRGPFIYWIWLKLDIEEHLDFTHNGYHIQRGSSTSCFGNSIILSPFSSRLGSGSYNSEDARRIFSEQVDLLKNFKETI